ncbi:hypothetical protein [Nostoc sp. TCL26-01]|uniref:hypothetical protein n=1 Tax=Nostoc sp. TCL26-01 TaxID=2576904 RepID=UPI0015BF694C|nr:hypothetical protein [Nostoc sp. TCL26-01]QLE59019.1 hypothetical protein FD725_28105 [Nostoc sp. TCL26-01]
MANDKLQKYSLAATELAVSLQIPQGDSFDLKVEQNQYSFYLNQQVVEQIQKAKDTGNILDIPLKLLVPLWYCLCFSDDFVATTEGKKDRTQSYAIFVVNILRVFWSKSSENQTTLQPGFTFNSYYQQEPSKSTDDYGQDCILQSVVLFHGDIIHKIQRDFIANNSDSRKIIAAHYWLSEQILNSLRNRLNLLVWELSSLVTGYFYAWNLYSLKVPYLENKIIFFIFLGLGITIAIALSRNLLLGQLQKRTDISYKYLNWLSWGITCIIPIIFFITWSISQGMININAILLPFVPSITPVVAKSCLGFFWRQVGKLIVRYVSSG